MPWPVLDHADKVGRIHQRIHRAGVQPGIAAAQQLHIQRAVLQIHPVQIGDLQLAAGRGLYLLGHTLPHACHRSIDL